MGGRVIGIDVDIREHNRLAIEYHPMYKNIKLIEGSSTDAITVSKVKEYIKEHNFSNILVALDSNHTHDHVLQEIRLYSELVSKGSYMVVFDTIIEDFPDEFFSDRPWGNGNNPKTAVFEFLKENDRFIIDDSITSRNVFTWAPCGYLKCVK